MPPKMPVPIDDDGFKVVVTPKSTLHNDSALYHTVQDICEGRGGVDVMGVPLSAITHVEEPSRYFLLRLETQPTHHLFPGYQFVKRHLRIDARYSNQLGVSAAHYTEVYYSNDRSNEKVVHLYFDPYGHSLNKDLLVSHVIHGVRQEVDGTSEDVCERAIKNASKARAILYKLLALQTEKYQAALTQTVSIEKQLRTAYRGITTSAGWENYQKLVNVFDKSIALINRFNDTFTDIRGRRLQKELARLQELRNYTAIQAVAQEEDSLDNPIDEPARLTKAATKRIQKQAAREKRTQIITDLLHSLRSAYTTLLAPPAVSTNQAQMIASKLEFQQQYRNAFVELFYLVEPSELNAEDVTFIQAMDTLFETITEEAIGWFRKACYAGDINGVSKVFPYLVFLLEVEFYTNYLNDCVYQSDHKNTASNVAICELFYNSNCSQYALSIRQFQYVYTRWMGELNSPLIFAYRVNNYDLFAMLLRHGYDANAYGACVDNRTLWLSNLYCLSSEQRSEVHRYIACLQQYGGRSMGYDVVESADALCHTELIKTDEISKVIAEHIDLQTGLITASAAQAKQRNPLPQSEALLASLSTNHERKAVYKAYRLLKSPMLALVGFKIPGEELASLEFSKQESLGLELLALNMAFLLSTTDVNNRMSSCVLRKQKGQRILSFNSQTETNAYCAQLSNSDNQGKVIYQTPVLLTYPANPKAIPFCQEIERLTPLLMTSLARSSSEDINELYQSFIALGDKMAQSMVAVNSHIIYRAAFVLILFKSSPFNDHDLALMLKSQMKRWACAERSGLKDLAAGCLAAIYNLVSCLGAFSQNSAGQFSVQSLTMESYQIYRLLQPLQGKLVAGKMAFDLQASKAMTQQVYAFPCTAQATNTVFMALNEIGNFKGKQEDSSGIFLRFELPTGLLKKEFRDRFGLMRIRVRKDALCKEQLQQLKTMHNQRIAVEADYEKQDYFLITAPQGISTEIAQVIDHWHRASPSQP